MPVHYESSDMQNNRDGNDLVTSVEVAACLGIHRVNAAALLRSGKLPANKVGNTWLVRFADLEAFAQSYVKGPGRRTNGVAADGRDTA